jgi:hypothetical protein
MFKGKTDSILGWLILVVILSVLGWFIIGLAFEVFER